MGDRTSISVTHKLADELYDRKRRGESYEDVIWRLIEQAEGDGDEGEDESDNVAPAAPDDDHGLTPPREGEPDQSDKNGEDRE